MAGLLRVLTAGCSEQHAAYAVDVAPPAPGGPSRTGGCAALPESVRIRWLAFDSNREPPYRHIYMMRADGSLLTRLTDGVDVEREPAFSPDGQRLAYVAERAGVAQIYVREFSSGEVRQITHRPEGADQPAWFPDGARLVVHSGAGLWVIDRDGANAHLLALGPDVFDGYKGATVTPDGQEVVCDYAHEIDAFDVQSGAQRQIVQNRPVRIEGPSVSPDGSQIVYSVACTDGLQIALAPTSGNRLTPCHMPLITPADGSRAVDPAWGPESYIAYERDPDEGRENSSIALVTHGATPCVLGTGGAHERHPAWAPADFALPAGFSPL